MAASYHRQQRHDLEALHHKGGDQVSLKLNKLPNRETAKITFTANAELKSALQDYAEIYRQTYGGKESVVDLIPFILDSFISTDHGFKRARKGLTNLRPSSSINQERET
ncbi:MAG: DUF2274 domain-containing protein [Rhizobiaceae bacterium]|nr:DUF2274 domain-containing protein [Rhizobiaceae bacterium]MBL4696428.1 DUF2274 domain-containing protein [Rhizobiaceae bacterium]